MNFWLLQEMVSPEVCQYRASTDDVDPNSAVVEGRRIEEAIVYVESIIPLCACRTGLLHIESFGNLRNSWDICIDNVFECAR